MRNTSNTSETSVYKVTGTVYVEAKSVRHAAHIAAGTFQMKENGPAVFVVEERTVTLGEPYTVDLSKKAGQPGYVESIKVGGTTDI